MATAVAGPAGASSSPRIPIGDEYHPHPDSITAWKDDVRLWPGIRQPDIIYYLLSTKACDLRDVKAFKSLESYNYLQSGWVGALSVHQVNDEVTYVKGQVRPSQAVNSTTNNVWVCAKNSGEVVTAGCSCMAGQAKVCSHVGAVLWKVDLAVARGMTGLSCTDETSQWNCGTKRNVEPGRLSNITFKLAKRSVDEAGKTSLPRPLLTVLDAAQLKALHENSPFAGLFKVPGTLLYKTLNAPARQASDEAVEDRAVNHASHSDVATLPESCGACSRLYEELVMSPAAATLLETETRSQSTPLWYASRRLRLTASTVKNVPVRPTTACEKSATRLVCPTFSGNASTRHGQRYEPVARARVIQDYSLAVSHCGTFVCCDLPWLSASPDGMIDQFDAILEIKCPNTDNCLSRPAKYDLIPLGGDNYKLCENGPNKFYMQVQFQMLCTKKRLCFFYIWSLNSRALVKVKFDEHYVSNNLPRLKTVYFCEMLPRIEKAYREGKLPVVERYKVIAAM